MCDIEFSLAYGGKILLHNARLPLTRGHRYGLVGKNGVGKTTLLRNIANHTIEGLQTELRTLYVQCEEEEVVRGTTVLSNLLDNVNLKHNERHLIEDTLRVLDSPRHARKARWQR